MLFMFGLLSSFAGSDFVFEKSSLSARAFSLKALNIRTKMALSADFIAVFLAINEGAFFVRGICPNFYFNSIKL